MRRESGLRYRKWLWWLKPIEGERENGRRSREPAAARSSPTVRLSAGSGPRVALHPAACQSPGFCLRPSCRPAASPPGEGSSSEGEERGKGREEQQKGEEKRVCVCRAEGGVGEIMSVQPRGCVFLFIYLKKFVMSHITQTSPGRGGSGWGVREGV